MHLAGSTAPLSHDKNKLAKIIENAGSIPILRNTIYTEFEEYKPPKTIIKSKLPWLGEGHDMGEDNWQSFIH